MDRSNLYFKGVHRRVNLRRAAREASTRTYSHGVASVLAFCGLVSLAAWAGTGSRARPVDQTRQEAYAVYSAVLPHLWPWTQLDAHNLVIVDQTAPHPECSDPNSKSPQDVRSAVSQYDQANRHSWRLHRGLRISRSYSLIPSGELEEIRRGAIGAWDLFFQRHGDSGGWIQFSAVGFNSSQTTAVVYASYHCGRGCGGGSFYVAHKIDGHWKVSAQETTSCGPAGTDPEMTGL